LAGRGKPSGRTALATRLPGRGSKHRSMSPRPLATSLRTAISEHCQQQFPASHHSGPAAERPRVGRAERFIVAPAMIRNRPDQSGFTLLEVLVAISLMAVLSILSWRALDTTARSNERLDASTDMTLGLMRVLGQLETDIAQHAVKNVLPPGSPFFPAGRPASVLPPGILWNASGLSIIRASQAGRWQQVVWSLKDGKDRKSV